MPVWVCYLIAWCYTCWLATFAYDKYVGHDKNDEEFVKGAIFFSPLWLPIATPFFLAFLPFTLLNDFIPGPEKRKQLKAEKEERLKKLQSPPEDPLEEKFKEIRTCKKK